MDIKIICLNLWEGGILIENIIDFLKKENADILMLQEVFNATTAEFPTQYHSIEILNERLNYEYYSFAPAVIDKVAEGEVINGNAIFSKHPINPKSVRFFDEPFRVRIAKDPKEFPTTPRNLQHVSVVLPTAELNLFNFQGVWDMDGGKYSPKRQKMGEVIAAAIKNVPNVVLAGDTNATPDNRVIADISTKLKNVFDGELTTTFNMRQKTIPSYATAVVDMMFVSENLQVVEHSCPDIDISDHLPLIVKLKI